MHGARGEIDSRSKARMILAPMVHGGSLCVIRSLAAGPSSVC
jgi:hypothetical protein